MALVRHLDDSSAEQLQTSIAAGSLQLCADHQSGCEACVHAMQQVFASPETEAIILVDATNCFNSLHRQTTLRNIRHLCPSKTWIVVKNDFKDEAASLEPRSPSLKFIDSYVRSKVATWVGKLERLSSLHVLNLMQPLLPSHMG